jgi:hypothetical protein
MGDIVNVLEAWEQKRETGLGHCPNFKVCNIDQTDAAKGPQCTPWPHFSFVCPKTSQQAPTGIETDVQSLRASWKATAESQMPALRRGARNLSARDVSQ